MTEGPENEVQPAEAGPFSPVPLPICPVCDSHSPYTLLFLETQAFMEEGPELAGLRAREEAVVYWGRLS